MMNISRHKHRSMAMQILYGLDLQRSLKKEAAVEALERKKNEKNLKDKNCNYYFETLVLGVIENLEKIDKNIEKNAVSWHLYRMPVVDRNILRIAIFEVLEKLPTGIAINEAVELAKEYGSAKSSSFINGVLSKIAEEEEAN